MARVWCIQHIVSRGDAAFFSGASQLKRLEGSEADLVEVRFRGHKGDQIQVGSVVVRTGSEVRGPRSELGEDGGAVAHMVNPILTLNDPR